VRISGLLAPGLLVLLPLLAACGTADAAVPTGTGPATQAAVPSYAAPAGAPAFCGPLAASLHLTPLPAAVGQLAADPWDVAAAQELTDGTAELQAVLADVRAGTGHDALATTLTDLVDALTSAADQVTGELPARIAADLAAVGEQVQPLCAFPV
jgi:hypothetical protein